MIIKEKTVIFDKFIIWYWIIIPGVFKEKKGIVCYRSPSFRQQCTIISSYTIDARITKPICVIPLCIQMLATYLKFFSVFHFEIIQILVIYPKMQFLCKLFMKLVKKNKCMGGSCIHHISNRFYHDFQITPPK